MDFGSIWNYILYLNSISNSCSHINREGLVTLEGPRDPDQDSSTGPHFGSYMALPAFLLVVAKRWWPSSRATGGRKREDCKINTRQASFHLPHLFPRPLGHVYIYPSHSFVTEEFHFPLKWLSWERKWERKNGIQTTSLCSSGACPALLFEVM